MLAIPAVIFWLLLMILPTRVVLLCPEECSCEKEGNFVNCSDAELNNIPSVLPTHVRGLVLDGNSIRFIENDTLFPEDWFSWRLLWKISVKSEK
jgi:hypothetical protein